MLPMLFVVGLAVVAFIKRCEFLPELCNPAAAADPAAATANSLTWDELVKAGKDLKKDKKRDENTLKASAKLQQMSGGGNNNYVAPPAITTTTPSIYNKSYDITGDLTKTLSSYGAKYTRVAIW